MSFSVRNLLCAFGISCSYCCLCLWENKTGSGIRGSSTHPSWTPWDLLTCSTWQKCEGSYKNKSVGCKWTFSVSSSLPLSLYVGAPGSQIISETAWFPTPNPKRQCNENWEIEALGQVPVSLTWWLLGVHFIFFIKLDYPIRDSCQMAFSY